MSLRQRIGFRRHSATFEKHNGNVDANGNPTYAEAADWTAFLGAWPVEFTATSGTEDTRGRQVTAETTHVIYGEFYGGQGITPEMRAIIKGNRYGVVSVLDMDGMQMELRVELKRIADA